jgi:hypothetical protein
MQVGQRRPARGGLERVDEHATAQQLVAGVGAVEAALRPGGAGRRAERDRAVAAQDRAGAGAAARDLRAIAVEAEDRQAGGGALAAAADVGAQGADGGRP